LQETAAGFPHCRTHRECEYGSSYPYGSGEFCVIFSRGPSGFARNGRVAMTNRTFLNLGTVPLDGPTICLRRMERKRILCYRSVLRAAVMAILPVCSRFQDQYKLETILSRELDFCKIPWMASLLSV